MWSVGNEIPEQSSENGPAMLRHLQDLIHKYDTTRPITNGMDRGMAPVKTGFAHVSEVIGMNYRTHIYNNVYKATGQGFLLGSETASTVSSRGVYKFPVERADGKAYGDVLGMDAVNYAFNHVERNTQTPAVSRESAKAKVGFENASDGRLCVIPYKTSSEKLCYEFIVESGGIYYIYIDGWGEKPKHLRTGGDPCGVSKSDSVCLSGGDGSDLREAIGPVLLYLR